MSAATFNKLSLTIPDGWEDGTTVTLLGPTPSSTAPLAGRRAATERPTIVLRAIPAVDESFANLQTTAMEHALLDFKVLVTDPVDLGSNKATRREMAFGPGDDRVRQIHLYVRKKDRYYAVIGTAGDDLNFDAVRKATIAVAQTIA